MSQVIAPSESVSVRLTRFLKQTDFYTLLLLLGVTHHLLWVKIATVMLLLLLSLLQKKNRLRTPPAPFFFYLIIPVLGLLGAVVTHSFHFKAYPYVVIYGLLQWGVSGLAFWLLFSRIARAARPRLENSLYVFVFINLLASFYWLGDTMLASGSWWPYGIPGSEQYGVSTGDYIRGTFGGSSVINAACNALLLVYFTQKGKWIAASAAMVCIWLCSSNLVVLGVLGFLFFQFLTQKRSRPRLVLFTLILSVGYAVINFQNVPYLVHMSQGAAVEDPNIPASASSAKIPLSAPKKESGTRFSALSGKKSNLYRGLQKTPLPSDQQRAATVLSQLGSAASGAPPDTLAIRRIVRAIYHKPYYKLPAADAGIPLKLFAMLQTLRYTAYHPQLIPFGAGMGNASSKLAMKVTGAGFHGSWPAGKTYVGGAFYAAHLQDLLYLFSQDASQHSIAHFPNNTYVQLLSEYGLAGLLLFLLLYVRYFFRSVSKSALKPWSVLLLTGLLMATDYWLESITIVFVFEMIMLLSSPLPKEKELPA